MTNAFYHVVGIAFLALARLKHLLSGYTTPKPFALDQVDKCIDYDVTIANRFLDNLARCGASDLAGKRVLELGPGSDLGIGLILISKGASAYVAIDRHNLAGDVPMAFYEKLARRVPIDLGALSDGRIAYIAREDFDLAAAVSTRIDVVLSNAAFEHFDDVEATVKSLSTITTAGAKAAIEIDLQTHSRWIRDADPNNIYRYPEMLYHLFKYPGQPNRLRPDDYRRAFERNGWTDITLYPENQLDERLSKHTVHRVFRNRQLDWLSFVLCATKGDV